MPPVKKRPRSYDSAKTRAAVTAQLGHVRDAVRTLSPEEFARPTRLGDWTVRELVAHFAMAVDHVPAALERPAAAKQEVQLVEWPFAPAVYAAAVDERVRAMAAEEDPVALLERAAERYAALVPEAEDDRLMAIPRPGAMRLGDLLVTRCLELVVHTDDLADALGKELPIDRQALAATTRLLADSLAAKAPGGSVEVRIPPYAVVQCVEGPRHTRGTPPNVVETNPLTWVRLATGRAEWAAELAAAAVSASGERADLGPYLPVLS
ncbi:maleylpyruvate isomerase family mycothiol-dependent enzyme [Streptomyces olivaceiscleroticus]|uniref:Maleylpyruvate isomerase family mycothiol-dependent enzyme n=1 Tax=Streptomyces olivaceiscleroticus TaxID=68245 RepID=A0ABN1A5J7_9ACTN